ncbi:hypothetical protein XENTR_v10022051 [Xenopus tropicalis]|nr:coiled-coil domain-containing protein 32 isoform X2 [Xenopus tropicalis]XP_012824923.1 coiled-coil domain-containing protein 32 isoform X2 [Xenopus tropicalis]XP_012824925.1 coiled-coil domain-containing protein 32 isoform X2 [Xenopus tropicalis]KAE8587646.1 hypothetical protein XENTR_v10022051 [Xenopus tropicalis]KAE8587647.1 hypothetical protein XENTR_v10022051 [Xenopus tropicalis]KAE8587648.1 hypothetical protein XENTR_v10022051 [Xenopus tropicalis]|eukprot:XP_012824923.1 PREDICTED: uncharacterized protein C15orf57 homolog isoform X2 [Xenopus tropicalis]
MKMIDNLECNGSVSGQDIWAEICPCPDGAQPLHVTEAFSDSFLGSSPVRDTDREFQDCDSPEIETDALHSNQKPWAPLQDSDVYLASLERKLQKIKGHSREVTSKEMLHSLGQAKKESWDRFLQENLETEAYMEDCEVDSSSLEHLRRWLQPEKVAINSEEVQHLIPAESLTEKAENEQDSTSAEQ